MTALELGREIREYVRAQTLSTSPTARAALQVQIDKLLGEQARLILSQNTPKPGKREQEMADLLHDMYCRLWTEAFYDPDNEATKKFAKPLAEILMGANEVLKFKK